MVRKDAKTLQMKIRRSEQPRAPVRGKGSALLEIQKELVALREDVKILMRERDERLAVQAREQKALEEAIKQGAQ